MKPVTEVWMPVLLNGGIFKDNYFASNLGRVRRKYLCADGSYQFKLLHIINIDRPVVIMYGNGKKYRKSVAKLVLSSFNYREGCECANLIYLDGNMKNCVLSNLMYVADKVMYDKMERAKKASSTRCSRSKPVILRRCVTKPEGRSCFTCAKNPCMTGMETFSTDFGASGCNDYKPRENNEVQ